MGWVLAGIFFLLWVVCSICYVREIAQLKLEKQLMPLPSDRDWTEDSHLENGNYICICCICQQRFFGHKRRVCCKLCWDDADRNFIGDVKCETNAE